MRFLLLAALLFGASRSDAELIVPAFQKWKRESEQHWVTDLSVASPAAALGDRREPGKWKVIPYATKGFRGKSLACGPETEAPAITVPLNATGWHAVYVGLANVARGGKADDNGIWLRLSGDPSWQRRRNTLPLAKPQRVVIEDIYLTVADLTGRSMEFRQMPFRPGAVMYIRTVPLSPDEVAQWSGQRAENPFRHMIATFDGHGMLWQNRPRNAADLGIAFDGFDVSDFGKWWFQIGGGDLTNYPSKVGTMIGSQTADFVRDADREFAQSVQGLEAAGVHVLQVAREEARRAGAQFHVFVRPSSWQAAIPWEENFTSRFFAAHPEWRCVDRDGTPTLYMSYAVPEVRRHIVEILRESLDCDPDGVGVLFHRGIPLVLWEPAFVSAYKARFGDDPRTVNEDDPTIGSVRADMLTAFMREIRAMLDEEAVKRHRTVPYKLSLTAFSLEKDNLKYGLDLARWVREGLVDGDISPTSFAEMVQTANPDLAYYMRVVKGTGVGVYPMFNAWRAGEPATFFRKLVRAYDAGVTGIAMWDPETTNAWGNKTLGQGVGQAFDAYRYVGHSDLLRAWAVGGLPGPRTFPLTQYGNNFFSRWTPNSGL